MARIEFRFKPNEFRDYSNVVLEGRGLCFRVDGLSLKVFTDRNHRVSVNVKCGRSKHVRLSLFSDTQKAI